MARLEDSQSSLGAVRRESLLSVLPKYLERMFRIKARYSSRVTLPVMLPACCVVKVATGAELGAITAVEPPTDATGWLLCA